MNTMKIIDMTLREPGQRNAAGMSFKEKLEIARTLDRLKLDTIELPPIGAAKADQLSNKTIASMVSTALRDLGEHPHCPSSSAKPPCSCFHRADGVHLP